MIEKQGLAYANVDFEFPDIDFYASSSLDPFGLLKSALFYSHFRNQIGNGLGVSEFIEGDCSFNRNGMNEKGWGIGYLRTFERCIEKRKQYEPKTWWTYFGRR